MLIRLRDFAEQNRITERTVQVHIKQNQELLAGHVDRRGKHGTWLDEFAQAFLLDKIQLPTKDEVLVPTPREASLMFQLSQANERWAAAEARAAKNAEAAGKIKLLEVQSDSLKEVNADLQKQIFTLERNAQEADQKIQEVENRAAAAEERLQEYEEKIQKLSKWKKWLLDI